MGKIWKGGSAKNKTGFSLVELLIVIGIIGILSSIVMGALNTAREGAKITKARSEIREVRSAVASLASDTGKWPNGCAVGQVVGGAGNEIELTEACSGITQAPQGAGCACTWTAGEIANWNGPYYQAPLDPWGNSYWFDSDYHKYENCAAIPAAEKFPALPESVAIYSPGPNNSGVNAYDCDDIFLEIY